MLKLFSPLFSCRRSHDAGFLWKSRITADLPAVTDPEEVRLRRLQLLQTLDKLRGYGFGYHLAKNCKGRSNKELSRFTDQIRSLIEKFK